MYGNSAFDGTAAFSGGGFMPSQATQTADTFLSPAKSRDVQCLLPLTVKQINQAFQASDDKANFLIDGVDVNNVKLVGLLLEKTERVTDIAFVLDDGTGRIDCHRWINEPLDSREMELLSNGMYVKVHGHLKGFQGKKQLVIYSVRRVTDYNEIANHFVECIYVHCYNTKRRKIQNAPQVNTPSKGHQPTSSKHVFVQYSNMDGIMGINKLILDYLQQPSCIAVEKGIHFAKIAQELNVPQQKILEAMKDLEQEGLVYSAIDDFHYKSAVNG